MARPKTERVPICFEVPASLRDRVQAVAVDLGITYTSAYILALNTWLDEQARRRPEGPAVAKTESGTEYERAVTP